MMRFPGSSRILVVKMRYIGDVLLITPFVRALRRGYPKAWIGVLVNKGTEEVLLNNPDIDEIITFNRSMSKLSQVAFVRELKKKKIETVIDLTNSDRSAWIAKLSGAETKVGFKGHKEFRNKYLYNMLMEPLKSTHQIDRTLELAEKLGLRRLYRDAIIHLTDDEMRKARELLGGYKGDYAVIHPGARRWYKSWTMERFAEVADEIKRMGLEVVICGGGMDTEKAAEIVSHMKSTPINTAGKTTVRDLAGILKGATFFLGNDSAPMHISSAIGTTTIALFGPTEWSSWHPMGKDHIVIAKEVDCRPCGHSHADCQHPDNWCMGLIKTGEVMEAIEVVLKEKALAVK